MTNRRFSFLSYIHLNQTFLKADFKKELIQFFTLSLSNSRDLEVFKCQEAFHRQLCYPPCALNVFRLRVFYFLERFATRSILALFAVEKKLYLCKIKRKIPSLLGVNRVQRIHSHCRSRSQPNYCFPILFSPVSLLLSTFYIYVIII